MRSTNEEEAEVMKRFEELVEMSRNAQNPKDFRVYADKAKEAAQLDSDNKWAPLRWEFFHQYTSILSGFEQTGVRPTPEDWKILKSMSSDETEPVLFRTDAYTVLGCLQDAQGEREEGIENLRRALDMVATATSVEKARLVHDSNKDLSILSLKPVGDVLAVYESTCRFSLEGIENPFLGNPLLMIGADEDLVKRFTVGGGKCDCCGRKRNDVEGGLLRCTRCRLAYYCSASCQEKQWKAGHKKACREPGDIRVGDTMRLKHLVNRPELNSKAVKVVGSAPGGRWEVSIRCQPLIGTISVAPENLGHIRPAK